MVKRLLWLDDSRNPFVNDWTVFSPIHRPFETIWVRNYLEFITWIMENGLPDGICFDHDLGTEMTGYDIAQKLCEYCNLMDLPVPPYAVQSANPVGKENIISYIENYKKHSGRPY